MRRGWLLLFSVLLAFPALAQNNINLPVYQSGISVTPGHVPVFLTNGVVGDGGSSAGGNITSLGITGMGLPFSIADAPITSQSGYHLLSLGANALGQGLLSYQAYGGATPLPLICNINGVSAPCLGGQVTGLPTVSGNAALSALPSTYAAEIVRENYQSTGGYAAPPLFYISSPQSCTALGYVNDGGSCVAASDGGAWVAQFQNGMIDIREFGAIPDGHTYNDAAFAAANAYATVQHVCTYIPDQPLPFAFGAALQPSVFSCIRGDRFRGEDPGETPPIPEFTGYSMVFPNDTDGIQLQTGANTQVDIRGLSLKGNASESTSANQTAGFRIGSVESTLQYNYIQDFVTGIYGNKVARANWQGNYINDQFGFPNPINNYPTTGMTFTGAVGSGASNVSDILGGEVRAQSHVLLTSANGNGSTNWFDITLPNASQISNYGVLWAADGIKVSVGPYVNYGAPPYLKTCGIDYTIWDISAGGGGGSGGVQLYCTQISATLTVNSTGVGTASTSGLPTGPGYLVIADHGIAPNTYISSIGGPGGFTLNNPATDSGTVNLDVVQINVGSISGSRTCITLSPPTCGHVLEVRLNTPPPTGSNNVQLLWSDPWGYAGVYVQFASDYLQIRPTHVGGYRFGLYHENFTGSGIAFEPTYIEIVNVGFASGAGFNNGTIQGDVVDMHRFIGPPIPEPYYINPRTTNYKACFNNICTYGNGSSLGEYFNVSFNAGASDVTGDGTAYVVPFDTVTADRDGDFNTGSSEFVAAGSGTYLFDGVVQMTGFNSSDEIATITLNTTQNTYQSYCTTPPTSSTTLTCSVHNLAVPMNVGDYARVVVQVQGGAKTVSVVGKPFGDINSWFSGKYLP